LYAIKEVKTINETAQEHGIAVGVNKQMCINRKASSNVLSKRFNQLKFEF